jgi:tetratricopeptide (TPR) repeat protein
MTRLASAVAAVFLVAQPCLAQLEDLETTLEEVDELARSHRYEEVIDRLAPIEGLSERPEVRYMVAAELGRAMFHLGRYPEAHQRFRQAVLIHPERIETALYLQATAYLLGERDQAFAILRELLRGGARDLYLAVTLPGERLFLADPEVWAAIDEFAVPVAVDLELGGLLGVTLGDDRGQVESALGAGGAGNTGKVLTAQAGPHLIWAFSFSDADRLTEATLYTENLVKYTPYRPRFGEVDWQSPPSAVIAALGPPDDTSTDDARNLVMIWHMQSLELTMIFGHARPPAPPVLPEGAAMLRMMRVSAPESATAIDDPNSASMGQ